MLAHNFLAASFPHRVTVMRWGISWDLITRKTDYFRSNPCHHEFIFENKNIFAFSLISQHYLDGTVGWNPSSAKTETCWSFIYNDGCWCTDSTRSQGIFCRGSDLVLPEYSGFNTGSVNFVCVLYGHTDRKKLDQSFEHYSNCLCLEGTILLLFLPGCALIDHQCPQHWPQCHSTNSFHNKIKKWQKYCIERCSDHYKFLHLPWQQSCSGMCKNCNDHYIITWGWVILYFYYQKF